MIKARSKRRAKTNAEASRPFGVFVKNIPVAVVMSVIFEGL